MDVDFWIDYLKNTGLASLVTFVAGFLVSRWTMTRKEKKDYQQTLYQNSVALMEKQNERFQEFATCLKKYISKTEEPTLDDFFEISTIGEKYFYQQQVTCEAILSGKIDATFRDNTLVPKVMETIKKSLPAFYKALQTISDKKGFSYSGKLERKNYESLYLVAEKYGKGSGNFAIIIYGTI